MASLQSLTEEQSNIEFLLSSLVEQRADEQTRQQALEEARRAICARIERLERSILALESEGRGNEEAVRNLEAFCERTRRALELVPENNNADPADPGRREGMDVI